MNGKERCSFDSPVASCLELVSLSQIRDPRKILPRQRNELGRVCRKAYCFDGSARRDAARRDASLDLCRHYATRLTKRKNRNRAPGFQEGSLTGTTARSNHLLSTIY